MLQSSSSLHLSSVLAVGLLATTSAQAATQEKPNLLFIMLDDVGYADFGVYGSEIATPTFDALAADGIQFSNFHASPTCSPSRASFLTGRDPHNVGMGLVADYDLGPDAPAFRGRITPKAATIAELLKADSYSTYATGKWHLGPSTQQSAAGPFTNWPSGKGFDRFYGFLAGSTDQFNPSLVRDNSMIDVQYEDGKVLTTDLIDNTITYVRDHVSHAPDRPFMIYMALPGMHSPHQASDEYIDKYKGKYDVGWDAIRQARFEKQKASGLIPKDATLAPTNPGIEQWQNLSDKQQKVYARFQEVYAGFLEETDHEVGRLVKELARLDQLDNTLVVLLSDNGGSSNGHFNGSANSSTWNNGITETVDDVSAVEDNIGRPGSGANYPRGWAQASNTPFPLYKMNTYGGGINVPLIMSWPKGIAARGELRHQYHFISDIMPTVLEIADVKAPKEFKGIKQLPLDGISMEYTFTDNSRKSQRTSQFYRMADDRGVYLDGWAAAAKHRPGTPVTSDHWSLYNLENDFTQSNDVSSKYPEKLKELQDFWHSEAKRLRADKMLETVTTVDKDASKGASDDRPPGGIFDSIQTHHIFYADTSHMPEKATPKVMNRSFTIDVPVSDVKRRTEGVLVAHGNSQSGYVLYVKNRKLVLEYNYMSKVASVGEMYKLVSEKKIPKGQSTLGFRYIKTGTGKGKGELLIDGQVVAKLDMPKTLATRISHEGLDVGLDRYNQVGNGYKGTFPFTATIEKVEYNIAED